MLRKLLVPILIFSIAMIPVYGFGEPYNTTNSSPDNSAGNSTNDSSTGSSTNPPTDQSTPTDDSTGTTNSSENESKAPRGDMQNWKQIFVDDFDEYGNVPVGSFSGCNNSPDSKQAFCSGLSEPLRSRWWAYPKGWPDTARQRNYQISGQYNPDETVSIEDGKLKVVMKSDGKENQVAALVPKATMGQIYGRYAIRFKADPTPGYKIAWLLWPVNENSCQGCEIDFPETELDRTIMGFIHPKGGGQQLSFATNQTVTDWHTAVIEWSPGKVEFFLDGQKVNSLDNRDVSTVNIPDQPMTWVIQSESALDDRAQRNQVVAQSGSTATILIDWVAAYSFTGNGAVQDPQNDIDTPGQTPPQNTDDQNIDQPQQPNPNEHGRTQDQPQNNDEKRKGQDQRKYPNGHGRDKDWRKKPKGGHGRDHDRQRNPDEGDQRNVDDQKRDQDQQPNSNEQDQDQEKQGTDDEQKKDQEKQQDTDEQKQEQKEPEITIHSVIVNDEQVEITANLEGVNDPKGNWLIYFNNDEPKRYDNQGATIKDTFDTRNIKEDEVPVTVEFDGKDADDNPIQVKTTKDVKVKDSEGAIREELINNPFSNQDIGGKLPKTATNHSQQIAIGLIFVLVGLSIFALLAVRNRENA